MSKYYYNKDYFERINTPDKAYWLGFLYADGCINRYYKNEVLRSMGLEISLCYEDRQHLQKFADALESNVPIKDKQSKYKDKVYKACRISISNTKMCYDLIALGCTPNKTFTIRMPSYDLVPKEYMRDFIRGYFDGDGCISLRNKSKQIEISFTGVSDMLKDISDFLIAEKILRVNPKFYHDKRSKAVSFYVYGSDNVKEVLDYFYSNAKTYLERKHKKYVDFYRDYDDYRDKRGVYFDTYANKYKATISINNHGKCLGSFGTIEEAIQARKAAEIEKMKLLNSPLNQ